MVITTEVGLVPPELNNMVLGIICIVCGFLLAYARNIWENKHSKIYFKESYDKGEIPVVKLNCGNEEVALLVDTGSNLSYLSNVAYQALKEQAVSEKLGKKSIISGTEVKNKDTIVVELPLSYCGKTVYETFHVLDSLDASFGQIEADEGITVYGILGTTFMHKCNWKVDFTNLCVNVK